MKTYMLFNIPFHFLAHLSTTCSRGAFRVVQCLLCVVKNFFKHLLFPNCWANLDQTWQECSLGGPLRKLFTENLIPSKTLVAMATKWNIVSYFHYLDIKKSLKNLRDPSPKNGYGPLINSGEGSRAILALLFCIYRVLYCKYVYFVVLQMFKMSTHLTMRMKVLIR